ncbi:sensor histidine kinase [Clostridium bowmanii]|uniref:sensor histidine kinase n=1 Tax=Clostridium bowmanii TaxID=132925 RepID=UPI001C0AFF4B|nr:sensor histidine kinase [Clostridium bowmanii]MBU3188116.1 sensor histidine kinase [Clostridium bowmanii]MCA1072297.1 sensor histidine kinase [Clostridium bowmanii]
MNIIGKFKCWYKDLKIRNKILVFYLPLTIIPILILANAANVLASRIVIQKTEENVKDNSKLIINMVETTLKNSENCANMLSLNLSRTIILNQESSAQGSQGLRLYNSLNNEISYAKMIFREVSSIAFIDNNFNLYSDNDNMSNNIYNDKNRDFINQIEKTNGINYWFPMGKRDFLVEDSSKPVLTIGKKIFNPSSGETMGYLVLNIDEATISSTFESMKIVGLGKYFISDLNGKVVASNTDGEQLKPISDISLRENIVNDGDFSKTMNNKGVKYIVTSKQFGQRDLKLVSVIPLEGLLVDLKRLRVLIQVVSIFCGVLVIFGSIMLSNRLTKPMVQLKNKMLMIQKGNLEVSFENNSKDEVGLLTEGFHVMLQNLKESLAQFKNEQKKKREYELSLLHQQIKPHFLYNTLDVIYTLSDMGMKEEVQKTTKALADFYRVVLSKGKEVITIREEIKNVEDYLAIQGLRYYDIFDYNISMEDEILGYSISKLTLQPIVENAIYHGLKWKKNFGHLSIKGYKQGEKIIFEIYDNGIGIEKEKLIANITKKNKEKSFGLYNVDQRIKLYFGEAYGISIKSEVGEYTEVTLIIPGRMEGELI